jgi:glutathione peroxidase
MKYAILLGVLLMTTANTHADTKGVYALEADGIDGKKIQLSQYAGKVALIVNTASRCGYTPQYKGLEALYEKYKTKGFVVLGFPSNDFGKQEPASNSEIKKFCELNYQVTFPMFAKHEVTGTQKQPVYKYLTTEVEKSLTGEIEWNFEKFIVDKKGTVVARFKSAITPDSEAVKSEIEKLLK